MKRGLLLLITFLALLSCEQEGFSNLQKENEAVKRDITEKHITSVVRFSEEMLATIEDDLKGGKIVTKSLELNNFIDNFGVISIERVFSEDLRFVDRQHKFGLHKWYRIIYNNNAVPKTKATEIHKSLSAVPGIELVEEDIEVKSYTSTPNDPDYSYQWGLKQSNGIDINVENVWLQGIVGDSRIIVVVTDTGVDLEHEDLKENCIPAKVGGSYNTADKNYNIVPSEHGTHVAGIISGVRNNSKGIAGIAGGDAQLGKSGVKILSAVMFGESESWSTTAGADGIVYGADNGALISQNSWGPKYDINDDGRIDAEELEKAKNMAIPAFLQSAIDYFITYAGCDKDGNQKVDSPMKGGIVVFAAGNDNIPYEAYCQYEPVVAVASIDRDGGKSSFSNYGSWVDICAPGSGIYSTLHNSSYGNLSGTSMACPMVSGVAALVIEARGGIGFTSEMLRECLIKGANPNKVHNYKQTGPLVDAFGAVNYGKSEVPEPIRIVNTYANANSIKVEWVVESGGNDMPAYGATVFACKDSTKINGLNPKEPVQGVIVKSLNTLPMNIGDTASLVLDKLTFEEGYYIVVIPFNYGALYANTYAVHFCSTLKNNPPIIESDVPVDNIRLKASETFQIKFSVSEPDNHSIITSWESASNAELWTRRSDSEVWLNIKGPDAKEGKYTARFIAKDSYGLPSTLDINYEIRSNSSISIAKDIPDVLLSIRDNLGKEISLLDKFYDEDGDLINYEIAKSSSSVAHIVENGGILYITPATIGRTEVVVTAKDPSGTSASQSFAVLVKEEVNSISIYPTQVDKYFFVEGSETETSIKIEVISEGGAVLYYDTITCSAFNPASIDISNFAPGLYTIKAESQEESVVKRIVKL